MAPRIRLPRALMALLAVVASALVALAPARAAQLTGRVDHAFMSERETFEYVVSLTGGDGRASPDVSQLSRDFEIVKLDRRDRVELAATGPVTVKEWAAILAPKRTGTLTVPGLSVDGLTSAPVKVDVVPALPADQPDGSAYFVRVDVGSVAPFAQSLVPIVVRTFGSINLVQGWYGQPAAEGATFTAQGSQRVYARTVAGKQYAIIEQSFLMQPQKSGTLVIEPITARLQLPSARNSAASALPNLMGRSPLTALATEEVTFKSRPFAVEVRPRPPGVEGWFLPARDVSLSEDWSSPPAKAQAGIALTRTIRLVARGASPEQLPPLPVAQVDDARQYEDDGHADLVIIDGTLGAALEKTVSVVPTRPGSVTLPAITVAWWNTDKARAERAELPPVTLTVAPEGGAASETSVATPALPAPTAAAEQPQAKDPPFLRDLLAQAIRHPWIWGGVLALVMALGAAISLRGRIARRREPEEPQAPAPAARPRPAPPARRAMKRAPAFADAAAAEKALVRACRTGDPHGAHAAFHAWLRIAAAAGAARFESPQMALAVRDLSAALYGTQADQWRGRDFLSAFYAEKRARRRSGRRARRARIAPLYPTG